jgi:hypothetical protein
MQSVISWLRLHKSVQYARAAHVVQPASKSARNTPQCPLQPSQHVLTGLHRTRISDYSDSRNYAQFNLHFDYRRGHSFADWSDNISLTSQVCNNDSVGLGKIQLRKLLPIDPTKRLVESTRSWLWLTSDKT